MDAAAVALIALVIFAWGLGSARLARADLSAPIAFVVVGLLLSEVLDLIEADVSPEAVKVLAEVTLVWVLFADAARVRLRDLRKTGLVTRLLAVGLPLTIAPGDAARQLAFDGIGVWMGLLVGCRAGTDRRMRRRSGDDRPSRVPERVTGASALNVRERDSTRRHRPPPGVNGCPSQVRRPNGAGRSMATGAWAARSPILHGPAVRCRRRRRRW